MTALPALPDPVVFAASALAAAGALIERGTDQALAILPPELARALDLAEEVRLSPQVGAAGTTECGLGAPLLEKLVAEACATVPVASIELSGPPPRPDRAIAAAGRFAVRNGVRDVVGTSPGAATYVFAALSYTAEADDRYQGLFEIVFDATTGGGPDPALADRLDLRRPDPLRGSAQARPLSMERAADILLARAEHHLETRMVGILEGVARRRDREHARIAEYFATMMAESAAPRRAIAPEAIAAKLDRLRAERDAKLADLTSRYAVRVDFSAAAIVLARVPVTRVQLRVRRRRQTRDLFLQLPVSAGAVDLLACDACPRLTAQPLLCDDALHILCQECAPSASGRPRCQACRRPPRPPGAADGGAGR